MSNNILGQEFIDLFTKSDLAMDVHGGNPYSPIWTCGMEFGGGETHYYKFKRNANENFKYDYAGDSQLIDDSPGDYEYARLITELVGCLTDKEVFRKLEAKYEIYKKIINDSHKNKEEENEAYDNYKKLARETAIELGMTKKCFCANGHGYRMNAFPLSLPNNDNWEETFVHYSDKRFPISVKKFVYGAKIENKKGEQITIEHLWQYKEGISNIFKKWTQERINKYKPRLIICTGKKYRDVYKELFLGEDPYKHENIISTNLGERPYNFELYKNNKTESFVLVCNFLTDRRPSTIYEIDIIPFVEAIRNIDELKWLDSLKSPEPIPIELKEIVEEIDFIFQKIPSKIEFFNSQKVKEYLNKSNANTEFEKSLQTIDPDWKNRYGDDAPITNGAKFFSLLDRNLCCRKECLIIIKDLHNLICEETYRQNIEFSKQYCKNTINEFKKMIEFCQK